MSSTTTLGFVKPVGADAVSTLRTSISANADLADSLFGFLGKTIVATQETRSNAAYGLMTTADRVQNVVLPTNGILMVAYRALWKSSLGGTNVAKAAVFVGSNQLKAPATSGAPAVQEALCLATTFSHLSTGPSGLVSVDSSSDATDVTTGQIIQPPGAPGGWLLIEAAAGTYDISVQFLNTAGTGTVVQTRKLWVRAVPN